MIEQMSPVQRAEAGAFIEMGFALGKNHTFGLVAGRCSAAQAQGLRRMRLHKVYKSVTETWEDFCPKYLKMSRVEADRTIRLLEEFGPVYFELSQWTRISPEAFRAIAPSIHDGALHINGEAIPLTEENARKVASAVTELRRAIPKPSTTPEWQALMQEIKDSSRDLTLRERIDKLFKCCLAIVAEFEKISADQGLTLSRLVFNSALAGAHAEFERLALANGVLEANAQSPHAGAPPEAAAEAS